MRLYVMKVSHFCERARWGLDHRGFRYEEHAWMPALHVPLARRLGKDTCVPILVTDRGAVQGSDAILTWAGFTDGDAALEHRFEAVIGPLVREYFYSGTLDNPNSGVRDVLRQGVSPLQSALGRAGWPVIRRAMAASMSINPSRLPDLERRLADELDWADTLVANDGPLAGSELGRNAITAASLLGPLARPDALPIYRQISLPTGMERAIECWRNRPILRWVSNTYDQHRH